MTTHSRRNLLRLLLGSTGLAALGSVLYPLVRYLTPLPSAGASGPIPVPAPDLTRIESSPHFAILRAAGTRIIVLQDPKRKLRALSAVCTHEGCTVQYLEGEQIIWCACHDGRYRLDGRVISGPPPRPLPRYTLLKAKDRRVEVSLKPPA